MEINIDDFSEEIIYKFTCPSCDCEIKTDNDPKSIPVIICFVCKDELNINHNEKAI